MRKRYVVSDRAFSTQFLFRDAAKHPFTAAFRSRKSADHRQLLFVEPRFGIGNVAHDQRAALPTLRSKHHGCDGTAAMNCESPFVSTTDAYAIAAPAAIFTRTVIVSSSGTPRVRSASAW